MIDKKSKLFFLVFFGLILTSIWLAYLRYYVMLDYDIIASVDCDPTAENCFISECDPTEEECTGDPDEDIWYYKNIRKKAYAMPNCDPEIDENCTIECLEDESRCEEIFCEDDNEGEIECTNQATFLLKNPDYLLEEEDENEAPENLETESSILEDNEGAEGGEKAAGQQQGNTVDVQQEGGAEAVFPTDSQESGEEIENSENVQVESGEN
jgi:hypothetical protein